MKTKKMIGILALMVALLFIGCPPETEGTDVESLTLTSPQEYLAPGQTLTLSAAVVPETAAVTFESDNLGVATVDEKGVVKGVSQGTAIITASAGTKTADVAVTVIPYTSISIKAPESYTIVFGTTLQLELEWEPASVPAPKNVKWVSSNPETFSVDETGLVTSNSSTESAEIYAEIYSGALKTAAVTVHGENAPAPMVENLRAFTGDSRYTIYWDSVEGATGYNLYYTTATDKPADVTKALDSETTSYHVASAQNGETINIWVEAIVADTIPLESPAHTTVTVGYADNENQTITIDSAQYTLDREVNFLEGTLVQKWPEGEPLYSVDPETGILTQNGGNSPSKSGAQGDYGAQKPGYGANSWLKWTPPQDVKHISEYAYIEVELKTTRPSGTPGFWVILNHNNDVEGAATGNGVSYEMVHYNNKSADGFGWYVAYGGEFQNSGKPTIYTSGTGRTLPSDTNNHQFGIKVSSGPTTVTLYVDRASAEAKTLSQKTPPTAWTADAATIFEFIFGAADCPNYRAEISKIRYYKAADTSTAQP